MLINLMKSFLSNTVKYVEFTNIRQILVFHKNPTKSPTVFNFINDISSVIECPYLWFADNLKLFNTEKESDDLLNN